MGVFVKTVGPGEEIVCCESEESFFQTIKSLGRLPKHVRCGRMSNIPFCCIVFYLFFWTPMFACRRLPLFKRFTRWYPPGKPFNYVPCFLCLTLQRRRKIKHCDYAPNDVGCCLYKK